MARPLLGPEERQGEIGERLQRSNLSRYLLNDETVVLVQHQHWASFAFARPILIATAGFLAASAFTLAAPSSFSDRLWWVWFALLGWVLWAWLEWRREWLVATDKRLLVNYGILRRGVSMINLSRVSDLTYTRTWLGQLLRYGTLTRESAKLPGSLHEIKWVKNPHDSYLTICAAIFDLQDRMFGLEEDDPYRLEDGTHPDTPPLYVEHGPAEGRRPPSDSSDEQDDEPATESPVIQIQYGESPKQKRQQRTPAPDLSEPSLRFAETGPIPYRRSATDASERWSPTTSDPDA